MKKRASDHNDSVGDAERDSSAGRGFEVAVVVDNGHRTEHLPLGDSLAVTLEDLSPVRTFTSYRGQRQFPGLWWCGTVHRQVGFESWLERVILMLLDVDRAMTGIGSQPG
jgi:hypothetical protein